MSLQTSTKKASPWIRSKSKSATTERISILVVLISPATVEPGNPSASAIAPHGDHGVAQ